MMGQTDGRTLDRFVGMLTPFLFLLHPFPQVLMGTLISTLYPLNAFGVSISPTKHPTLTILRIPGYDTDRRSISR